TYMAKGTSWELAAGSSGYKDAAGRDQWQLAEDAAAGDRESFALFKEFAETMPGTRSCVVSPALAAVLGLDPDDDAEGGEQVLAEPDGVVGRLAADAWSALMRSGEAGALLERVEREVQSDGAGWDAVQAWALAAAARFEAVDGPPPDPDPDVDVE